MKGSPWSRRPTSNTCTTCAPRKRAIVRASRSKRLSVFCPSGSADLRRNFSATRRSRSSWVASTTTPIPPWPSTRSTRYLPANTAPMRTSRSTKIGHYVRPRALPLPAAAQIHAAAAQDERQLSRAPFGGARASFGGVLGCRCTERQYCAHACDGQAGDAEADAELLVLAAVVVQRL